MINWSQTFKTLMSTETVPGVLFMGVLFTFAAWLGGRAVRLAVHRLLDRSQEDGADPTGIRFLGQLSRLMVYIFAAVCYARGIPALEKFGEVFLTSVGVVSIVVGLAAQSTLGNLISGTLSAGRSGRSQEYRFTFPVASSGLRYSKAAIGRDGILSDQRNLSERREEGRR